MQRPNADWLVSDYFTVTYVKGTEDGCVPNDTTFRTVTRFRGGQRLRIGDWLLELVIGYWDWLLDVKTLGTLISL